MSVRVEVCVQSPADTVVAEQAGADRVELCGALILGGLTPSIGSVTQAVRSVSRIGIHVLIRPREGDFVYTPDEVDEMIADIAAVRRATEQAIGEVGFVIGALTPTATIDRSVTTALRQAAGPAPVSFHRAFDLTEDMDRSLDTLIELGIGRVLTGGGVQRAADGVAVLARLVERSAGRIDVMPGGSVRSHNAARIIAETGARDLHFRAPAAQPNHTSPFRPGVRMASSRPPNETARERTSIDAVREMVGLVAASPSLAIS